MRPEVQAARAAAAREKRPLGWAALVLVVWISAKGVAIWIFH